MEGHTIGDIYIHVHQTGLQAWTWRLVYDAARWVRAEIGDAHPARPLDYTLALCPNDVERVVWVKWKSARNYRYIAKKGREIRESPS